MFSPVASRNVRAFQLSMKKPRSSPNTLGSRISTSGSAVGVTFIYHQVGISAIVFFGIAMVTFQYLLGQLLLSQQRAEELEKRSKQLASFQVGMLSAMLTPCGMISVAAICSAMV